MKLVPTRVAGAFVVESEANLDERGWFARTFDREIFLDHGLDPDIVQCSLSFNRRKGTLRGMHFQRAPHEEAKLVRCVSGAIYDVVLDLRPDSETYRAWDAAELTAKNLKALYLPKGTAHGFQTLHSDTTIEYLISTEYHPGSGGGVRWDDPAFGIEWPDGERFLNERDQGFPDFRG